MDSYGPYGSYSENPELAYAPVGTTGVSMSYPGFGEGDLGQGSANSREDMLRRFRLFQQMFGQGQGGGSGGGQQPSGFAGGFGAGLGGGLSIGAGALGG